MTRSGMEYLSMYSATPVSVFRSLVTQKLVSIGMLIHMHFLWNHVDILVAAVCVTGDSDKDRVRGLTVFLVNSKLYLLPLGTTALSLVTTPFLIKLIPAVVHLGVFLRWFSPDSSTEIGFKGDLYRSESAKLISQMIQDSLTTVAMLVGLKSAYADITNITVVKLAMFLIKIPPAKKTLLVGLIRDFISTK
ncbi:hypothetical protein YC2023_081260 [Brassica napus]